MKHTEIQRHLLTTIACILACALPLRAARTIYVDPNAPGQNDGSSWANAYNYLQDALADANSSPKPVEIRVARGMYHPDRSTADPDGSRDANVAFQLINDVAIKGGYGGYAQADPNAQDFGLFESILSGDIQQNDTPYQQHDNSKRVVDGSHTDRTAVINGFTITKGLLRTFDRVPPDFDPGWTARASGGMRSISGSPTIINCTFRQNHCAVFNAVDSNPDFTGCRFEQNNGASDGHTSAMINIESHPDITACTFIENHGHNGGAIYSMDCDVLVADCTFSGNRASGGGAILNVDTSVLLTGCKFLNNRSAYEGGAVHSHGGRIVIDSCTFNTNMAGTGGGAVYVKGASDVLVEDCKFNGNEAMFSAGALHARADCVTLSRCLFRANSAADIAGAAGLVNNSIALVSDCVFASNTARFHGGALFSTSGNLTLSGCFLLGNRVTDTRLAMPYDGVGSALIQLGDGPVQLSNCTLVDNTGTRDTSVIAPFSSLTVRNSIIWDVNAFEVSDGNNLDVIFSNVRDGLWGAGNISVDPLFTNPGYWDPNGTPEDPNDDFWVTGDYYLKSQAGRWNPTSQSWLQDNVTSPCIDAGNPMTPIGREPFPNAGIINMGAYGGTPEASKSWFDAPACETIIAGDINGDCIVDFRDFRLLALHWLEKH